MGFKATGMGRGHCRGPGKAEGGGDENWPPRPGEGPRHLGALYVVIQPFLRSIPSWAPLLLGVRRVESTEKFNWFFTWVQGQLALLQLVHLRRPFLGWSEGF